MKAGGPSQVAFASAFRLMSTQLPATLLEWKVCITAHPRDIWNPLEGYFRSQGLTLWVPGRSPSTYPADRKPRAPDGFAHFIPATLNERPFLTRQYVASFLLTPTTNICSREISTVLQPLKMGDMFSFAWSRKGVTLVSPL